MANKKSHLALVAVLALAALILTTPVAVFGAGKEKLLFKFNRRNGLEPSSPVTFDSSGNLYGTTVDGGSHHLGVVFQLTPAGNGRWTEKVLYSFNGTDGQNPYAGVVINAASNLYGTTVGVWRTNRHWHRFRDDSSQGWRLVRDPAASFLRQW
jgi:uncharacterized repeat protein (TIGR03803 family)